MLPVNQRNKYISRIYTLPAPVKGWNDRDPISNMKEGFALTLENWFPGTKDVSLRKGYSNHVTDIGSQVESLMPYSNPNGTQTLFCAAGTSFYDVTSSGSVGAAVVTGLSNARWQSINFTNSGGTSYLCCVNGADSPQYWNGSSWITVTGVSSPAITGVTTSNLSNIAAHKRRIWFTEINTLKAWYLPVDSVGGAANALDLSGIADLGGYLVAIGTWSLDAGNGIDDYWIGVTSGGQVVVYQGTDPSSASTWALVGVWKIGQPIGKRCLLKYQGDLLIICVDGVYPLSKALKFSQTNPRASITDLIQNSITENAALYASNFGWQLLFYPKSNMILLNVPVAQGSSQEQYAMNTITGAWGHFKGISANCWALHSEEPYFGGNGVVGKFWDTLADNNTNIDGDLKIAFNYFGSRGIQKKFNIMRPILLTNGSPSILAGLNVDYEDAELTSSLTFTPTTAGTWDNAKWDVGTWGGDVDVSVEWESVSKTGTCAALRLVSATAGIKLRLEAIDFVLEKGGVFG